jgi:putative transposase
LSDAFIADHQQTWPVVVMCEVLGVGRSGLYDSQRRQRAPARSDEEIDLLERIKAIAEKTRHSYGSRRLAKQRQDEGYAVGRFTVRRLMKQAGIAVAGRCRRRPHTTDSRHGYAVAPNLLKRHFDVTAPNVAWCGDITYIWTEEGWLYTSVLVDLYARTVVGWAMSDHGDTHLVREALEMALGRRQPGAGLIHHSDRGAQYASHAYRSMLAAHGIACSMSGKGECLDHAVAARFFGRLKRERTSQRYYVTRQDARDDHIDYIEMFYNSWRTHAYLGYVSPNEYEKIAQAA